MCMMSSPSVPAPPPPPPPPPEPPQMADEGVQQARTDERARARQAAGASSTIRTSATGVAGNATTAQKKLTGQ